MLASTAKENRGMDPDEHVLQELLPLCLDKRIAIVAGGVYNSGILADPRPEATFAYVPAGEEVIERAVRLQSICHAHGVPLKAAAIPADLWQGLKAERLISEHAPVPGSRDAPHT
jgi:D-threo-aldose 1-dehydrogenase